LQNYTLTNGLEEPRSVGDNATTLNTPNAPGGSSY